jgi:hypothetical protein
MRSMLPWIVPLTLLCACNSPPGPRLNAPPHGDAECKSEMQAMYVHMTDNALLADMSVSDADFLPHRPILSDLGEQRLCRLAGLMQEYGGEIRYTPGVEDDDLVDRRIEAIIDYLAEAGLPASPEAVREGLPGGHGMEAREAILIKAAEGTYHPKQTGGLGLPMAAPGK